MPPESPILGRSISAADLCPRGYLFITTTLVGRCRELSKCQAFHSMLLISSVPLCRRKKRWSRESNLPSISQLVSGQAGIRTWVCQTPEPLDLPPVCQSPSGTHSHAGLQPVVGISHLQSLGRGAACWPGRLQEQLSQVPGRSWFLRPRCSHP